jgi:hypothetical protein
MSSSEMNFNEVKTGDEFIRLLETGDFDFEFQAEECEKLFPQSANFLAQVIIFLSLFKPKPLN